MGFVTGVIGGSIGTACHMVALSVQKRPLSRMPWCHVGYFIAGYYIANKYKDYERKLFIEVNEIRTDSGLPPFQGGHVLLPGMMEKKE